MTKERKAGEAEERKEGWGEVREMKTGERVVGGS